MNSGAVVTISLNPQEPSAGSAVAGAYPDPTGMAGQPGVGAQQAANPTMGMQPMQPAAQQQPHPFAPLNTQPASGFASGVPQPGSPAGMGFQADPLELAVSMLSQRAMQIMRLFVYEDIWGVKDISEETDIPTSSTYSELKKLEEAGMMTRLGKKYRLTELGERVAQNLS